MRWDRNRAVVTTVLATCVVLSGCGLAAGEPSAEQYSDQIGTDVSSTTTTTAPAPPPAESIDSAAVYRNLIEKSRQSGEPVTTEVAPSSPYCFAMEQFVFEMTQMFLSEDVAAAMERHSAAITSIDAVAAEAPDSVAGPARVIRQQLVDTVALPGVTASPDALGASLTATVNRNAELIDGMLVATIEECQVSLTDPLVPAAAGLQRITGG